MATGGSGEVTTVDADDARKEKMESCWRKVRLHCLTHQSATLSRTEMSLIADLRDADSRQAVTDYMIRQNVARPLTQFLMEYDPDGSKWDAIHQLMPVRDPGISSGKQSQTAVFFPTIGPNKISQEPVVILELVKLFAEKLKEKLKCIATCTYKEFHDRCFSILSCELTCKLAILVLYTSNCIEIGIVDGQKKVHVRVDGDSALERRSQADMTASVAVYEGPETVRMMSEARVAAGSTPVLQWPNTAPAPSTTAEVSKQMADLTVMDAEMMEVDEG